MGIQLLVNRPRLSRVNLTRKNFLPWLRARKSCTIQNIIREFQVEPASALRREFCNLFPKDFTQVSELRAAAQNIYSTDLPAQGYIKALALIVRMKDEGEVYITSDQSTLLSRAK